MRQLSRRLLPYLVVISALVLSGAGSLLLRSHLSSAQAAQLESPTALNQPIGPAAGEAGQAGQANLNSNSQGTSNNLQSTGQTPATTNPQATSPSAESTASPTAPARAITVSINGNSGFSLNVPAGANHCDVLTQALAESKLSSLDMRFESSYGSYGVYKINGVGRTDQIWWTYKVNGQAPPYGCSYIKVNDHDQVVWTYVGPS